MVSASRCRFQRTFPAGSSCPISPARMAVGDAAKFVHEVVSKLLIAAIGVHVAAALNTILPNRMVLLRMLGHSIIYDNAHDDNLDMFAIPFSVNMNGSGQIGRGLLWKDGYRTID